MIWAQFDPRDRGEGFCLRDPSMLDPAHRTGLIFFGAPVPCDRGAAFGHRLEVEQAAEAGMRSWSYSQRGPDGKRMSSAPRS